MLITMYQVDAFTNQLFRGNPAAICPLQTWLSDEVMQNIAAENNLSETAFFVKQGERYALRWFTPATEVDLCGHATLATAFVIFNFMNKNASRIYFDTRSGELSVQREGDWLTMDFPSQPPTVCNVDISKALGVTPIATYQNDTFLLAVLENETQVKTLQPDLAAMMQLENMGVIASAQGTDVDFVSRMFGPKVGIPEDPVTGSAHCLLTPYWAERLGKTSLLAHQVSARGGVIRCQLKGSRVALSGQAVLFLKGDIYI